MPKTTKQAMEESLKWLLIQKPLDKITISNIIRPILEAVELHEQQKLHQLELDTARWEAQKSATERIAG